jgi:hypothetical protein
MRPLAVRTRAAVPGLVLLVVAGSAPAAAQEGEAPASGITWEVGAPKAGWCLHFLMEPKDAAKDLVRGHRLVLAGEAEDLPAQLHRLVTEEPQYAGWAPAELCTYVAEAIWVDGRRFDRGDGGQPIAVLYWGVSATSAEEGTGAGAHGKISLRVLATNSSGMRRAMEIRTVPIDRVQIEVVPVKESDEDEEFLLKLEGATIIFIGHPSPDSTLAVAERSRTGAYMGNNKSVWGVEFSFLPGQVDAMAGALRIIGKRGLAKLLDHSPIRLLSPILSEGRGTVRFTR